MSAKRKGTEKTVFAATKKPKGDRDQKGVAIPNPRCDDRCDSCEDSKGPFHNCDDYTCHIVLCEACSALCATIGCFSHVCSACAHDCSRCNGWMCSEHQSSKSNGAVCMVCADKEDEEDAGEGEDDAHITAAANSGAASVRNEKNPPSGGSGSDSEVVSGPVCSACRQRDKSVQKCDSAECSSAFCKNCRVECDIPSCLARMCAGCAFWCKRCDTWTCRTHLRSRLTSCNSTSSEDDDGGDDEEDAEEKAILVATGVFAAARKTEVVALAAAAVATNARIAAADDLATRVLAAAEKKKQK